VRLFLGIELEDAVSAAAADVARRLEATLAAAAPAFRARWVPRDTFHITLWFIGEASGSAADALLEQLRPPLGLSPFQLRLAGCGVFPPSGPPRVLWIGTTEGAGQMREIHERIRARLVPIGFAAERRPYSPHLTMARVTDPGRGPFAALRQTIAGTPAHCGGSVVTAVTLFRSRLSSRGAAYEPLLRVPLS
jgi:RNA 2',3'-cyclic 3'-phosphodiesterase